MVEWAMDLIPDNSCCRLHRAFSQPVVPAQWGFPSRRNRDQHLIYVRGGEGFYLIEREGRLEKVSFVPGMVIYVPSGVLHGGFLENRQNRPRIMPLRFGFYPPRSRGQWEINDGSREMLGGVTSGAVVYMTRLSPWWRETFERICHIYRSDHERKGAAEACGTLLESLLRQLVWEGERISRSDDGLHRIRKLMDESSGENHGLGWFAQQAGYSEKHFQKQFSRRFGISPMAYYRKKRMERALTLLQDTRMGVDEVGRAMGYADGFSFSRAFKKFYGISPGKARNR